MMGIGFFMGFIIFSRLFYLQIVKGNYYQEIAFEKNQGYTEIPARRGEILIQDSHSGEPYALATNTTLNLLYADPSLIEDPGYVGGKLAPLLFDLESEKERDKERYENLMSDLRKAQRKEMEEPATPMEETTGTETPTTTNPESSPAPSLNLPPSDPTAPPSYGDFRLHTDDELFALYQRDLIDTLSQKTRSVILLTEDLDEGLAKTIRDKAITGVEVTENGKLYTYPSQISDKDRTSKTLADILDMEWERLQQILIGRNRYAVLKRKLAPEISDQIEKLIHEEPKAFFGIRMKEEYFRFYPEGSLAAQVLGYVNHKNNGQYGIEGTFDDQLEGKSGYFSSQIDASGKQITVGDSEIVDAVNGANITLTLDRSIQAEAEKLIAKGVENFQADSGQIIVQETKTGRILAMAHYPTFDPNTYGDIFKLEEVELSQNDRENLYRVGEGENEKLYLYIRKDPDVRIEIFYDKDKDKYYKYANNVGPEVYQLKAVTLPYEPGSVFKAVAMASGVDADEVTPYTTFFSDGPVQVDEYEIHTFNDEYYGTSTMTEVLIHSDNTGMVFVARKLGRALFYDYLKNFGFGKKTNIEFEGENAGRVEYYDYWAESELVTKAFGQGITVTPIQLITAISAVGNGGLLMQPYIVDSMDEANGKNIEFEPHVVQRVLKEETSDQVTSMMIAVVENGAPNTVMEDHFIAGKSGTAQTYKYGKALKGKGTTIASFTGFAPVKDPQFTILVKLDRPKTSEWAEGTSGKIFKEMAQFLFQYYNIPPDKNLK